MTGSDDGGFKPHPGDPWHPGWSQESVPDDSAIPVEGTASEEPTDDKPERRRRFGRRKRDEFPGNEADEVFDDGWAAGAPVVPGVQEAPLPAPDPDVDDPFDEVLRAEGRSVRRRRTSDGPDPAPAWMVDEEPPADLTLPPSALREPTVPAPHPGAALPVEEIEQAGLFDVPAEPAEDDGSGWVTEPVSVEASGDGERGWVTDGPSDELAGDDDSEWIEGPATEAASVEAAIDPPPSVDETADPADSPIVGEYGVAGPEAFAVLADTAEQDLDDWEAFMGGDAAPPAAIDAEIGGPSEPVGDLEIFDEWTDAEPKKKRRWFGRKDRSDDLVEDLSEDLPVVAYDEGGEWQEQEEWLPAATVDRASPDVDHSVFMPPAVNYLPAIDTDAVVVVSEDVYEIGALDDDPQDALAEALAALGVGSEDEVEPSADSLVEQLEAGDDQESVDEMELPPTGTYLGEPEVWEVASARDGSDFAVATDQVESHFETDLAESWQDASEGEDADRGPVAPTSAIPVGAEDRLPATPEVEESLDWEGDASRIPASWFADIDEDTVVPPAVVDTPETEWPTEEAPRQGQEWESEADTEVFDVEAALRDAAPPARLAEAQPPHERVVIPEGYEVWGDAVADATAGADEVTAEYLVEGVAPGVAALPVGFEPFPGTAAAGDHNGADTPAVHRDEEDGWMDDPTDLPGASVEDDSPYSPYANPADEVQFDASIYATSGTVEHRGLAEAIAAAGDDDTEWQAMSAAMPGVETGVLGFEDVADLAHVGDGFGDEYVAPTRSNLGVRVSTGLVLVGLLVGSLYVGGWAFALFVSAIVLLGLGEFFATLRRAGYLPLSLFGLVGGAGTLAAAWFHGPIAIPAGILLTSVATFFFYAFAPTRRDALSNGGLTVLGVAWVVGSVAFAIPIARSEEFVALIFAVVAVTAAADIGAYSFGRTWGKRPLSPYLSPHKTLEGLLGGIVLAMAAGAAIGYFEFGPFDLTAGLAVGAVVVIAAPLGDLAESMIKRSLGVKDMGSILPGHGGVLDRIDALIFVIPAAWVLFEAIGYLG